MHELPTMPLESPTFPQSLWPYISHLFAVILATVCTLILKRKKEPAEIRKLDAETAHIGIADQLAIIDSVTNAAKEVAATTMRAERLFQERQHWERKAEGFYLKLEAVQLHSDQQDTMLRLAQHDITKMSALLKVHGISYSEADKR